MAKITVAIPTYNREHYLSDCLKSVLAQSCQDFEIIIFDNHSDYDIAKFIENFKDSRIKLIINQTNLGHLHNLNNILHYQFASPYVIIFHDDDTMHPELLAQELSLLEKNKDLVFVVTGLQGVKNHDLMFTFVAGKKIEKNYIFPDQVGLVKFLLKHGDLCFDSIMYKSSVLRGILDYDKEFFRWSDRPYFIDIAKTGSVAVIDAPLVNYRIHLDQGSQTDHSGEFIYFINLFNYYKNCLPQPLSRADKKLFYSWSTNNLILAISWFANNRQEYLKLLKQSYKNNLFKPWYLNIRGLYYFFLVTKTFLFKWVKAL